MDSLRPVEERTIGGLRLEDQSFQTIAGGMHAVIKDSRVRLFTPGSSSRGIPYKEWEIPPPFADPEGYDFYPGANVIAFVRLAEVRLVLSL